MLKLPGRCVTIDNGTDVPRWRAHRREDIRDRRGLPTSTPLRSIPLGEVTVQLQGPGRREAQGITHSLGYPNTQPRSPWLRHVGPFLCSGAIMTCNREDLPDAPPLHIREQMVEQFWNSPKNRETKRWHVEVHKAIANCIISGWLIFIPPDTLRLTKEGHDSH